MIAAHYEDQIIAN